VGFVKVGVIGLGDIARKAYLPVVTALPGVEPRLQSRSAHTVRRVAETYRIPEKHCFTDLDALLAQGLDAAFVHAPTSAHPDIVRRLVDAGVPTYVDKPLADNLADSARVVEHALSRGVGVMVGFNRRFAPAYARCRELPRALVTLRKNRVDAARELREVVFDDFIHVLDTLRFLAPDDITHVTVRAAMDGHLAHHLVAHLDGPGYTATGTLDLRSGSTDEVLEISGHDTLHEVRNLTHVTAHHAGTATTHRPADWTPVARGRGIEPIVLAFLQAVTTGDFPDPADALRTHELCEQVVTEAMNHP